jgi:flagella basal body P-ring formation protein FlgA
MMTLSRYAVKTEQYYKGGEIMQIVSTRKLHNYNRTGLAVQIPEYVVATLNLKQGDKIDFFMNGKEIKMRKAVTK